jgi:hypothetical protein
MAAAGVQAADNQQAGPVDAKAAFDRLAALVGEWEGDNSMGKSHITYELIAGGTVLLERERGERMPTMLTMYHLDGDRLMLTHYCAAGNQPRMQARSFDAAAGVLRFEFLDATNLAKDGGHMRNATLRFVDKDHLSAVWEFFSGGERKSAEDFQYSRVR